MTPYKPMTLAFLLAFAGCATSMPLSDQMTAPSSAISAAREAGAAEIPQASLHLKMAEDQVAQAKSLMEDNESERADRVLQRAYVDARLALELARLETTRSKANGAIKRVQDIQQENRDIRK